jgi:predicted nucleic acid-binding protein
VAGDLIILDACCVLNLCASERFPEILDQMPYRFCLGRRAREEAQWIWSPDRQERQAVDISLLLEAALIEEQHLRDEKEQALFVSLARGLADGEAEAAALAICRGFILATDDLKARRLLGEEYSSLPLITTLELLRQWQSHGAVPRPTMAGILRSIQSRASYIPRRADPLWDWWVSLIGEV